MVDIIPPALQDFVEREFGGSFDTKLSLVTVGTTVTKIVDHNFERMSLTFVVLTSTNVNIAPTSSLDTTKGIQVNGGGGFFSVNARDDIILPGFEWYGIVTTGSTKVYVIEVIRFKAA